MSIPFIRMFPNNRAAVQQIARPFAIERLALDFLAAGGWYGIEVLPTGAVRLSVLDEDLKPLETFEAANGPTLPQAVDELVQHSQRFIYTQH